jgi:5-formyltetrahydrofolate cyclo-ligase
LNTNHKSEKQNIRKFLIDRRNELSSEHETRNNSHIHIRTLLEDIGKCKIGSYFPFRNEISTKLIHELLFSLGFEISLPCINDKNQNLIFRNWKVSDDLVKNKYGIFQPQEDAIEDHPEMIIVPLVGFSMLGYRLGYGGGYYDRFIDAKNKADKIITVGFGYTFQEVDDLPIEPHDQKLNWILTEKYLYKVA